MSLTSFATLTGLLICGALAAQAQSEAATAEQRLAEDVGLERLPNTFPTATGLRNISVLQQSGNNNAATISQQNPALTPNQAIIIQAGESNSLSLNQLGENNRFSLSQKGGGNLAGYTQNGQNNSTAINQNGSQNKVQGIVDGTNLLLEGEKNTMVITQTGDYNTVKGRVQESNRVYEIRQYGYNNTLTQIETTMSTPKGYSVEMRGTGINLTIEQGKAMP